MFFVPALFFEILYLIIRKEAVVVEVLIDKDLYFLLNAILYFDNCHFDSDILLLLNDLNALVTTKLLQDFDFDKFDINDENVVYKFYPNKRKIV